MPVGKDLDFKVEFISECRFFEGKDTVFWTIVSPVPRAGISKYGLWAKSVNIGFINSFIGTLSGLLICVLSMAGFAL